MRVFAAVVALCAISQTAWAQKPECKTISDSSARLACYDKAAPPARAKQASQAAEPSRADSPKYVDAISAEDAVMNARLKNICRGC
jgi:hypothetical protein